MLISKREWSPPEVTTRLVRGGRLRDQEDVIQESLDKYGDDPQAIPLGSIVLPGRAGNQGICFIGSPGCGKTIYINQILRNRLYHVGRGYGHRLCIWGEKGEERKYLGTLKLSCPVYYINPFDDDGVGIDFSTEVTGPREALRLAQDLLSAAGEEKGESLVWLKAATMAFSEVVKFYQRNAKGNWRLIDVLNACMFESQLRAVLSDSHKGKAICSGTLGARRQAKGVMFTLQANLEWLWPLAAAMRVSRNISLKRWVEDYEAVLVLPNIDEYEASLGPLHRNVFGRLGRLINSRAVDRGETYTFFVDELQRAPFPDYIVKLVTVGRSKGCALIAGAQDVEGVQETLGEKKAGIFFGCCSTQVWMQTNNPHTAEFASRRFGSPRVVQAETSQSETRSATTNARWGGEGEVQRAIDRSMGGNRSPLYDQFGIPPKECPIQFSRNGSQSQSVNFREMDQVKVLPDEFMQLPKPPTDYRIGDELTLHAFITSTFLGQWRETSRGMQEETIFVDPSIPSYRPRPDSDVEFHGWSDEERRALKIPDPLELRDEREDD